LLEFQEAADGRLDDGAAAARPGAQVIDERERLADHVLDELATVPLSAIRLHEAVLLLTPFNDPLHWFAGVIGTYTDALDLEREPLLAQLKLRTMLPRVARDGRF
jgi:hypothetical protein